jgi:hypothetical protein
VSARAAGNSAWRLEPVAGARLASTTSAVRPALAMLVVASLFAGGSLAGADRGRLTPQQAQQVLAIAREVKAERQAKLERRRSAAAARRRTRDAKMAAALELGAEIKASRAHRQEKARAAKQKASDQRNAARLRFIESLLRERAQRDR